jgi:hypothetical protein
VHGAQFIARIGLHWTGRDCGRWTTTPTNLRPRWPRMLTLPPGLARMFAVVPARDQKGTRCVRLHNAAAAPATVSGEPSTKKSH